jgi:phosphoribosylformylglycinamidine synthase
MADALPPVDLAEQARALAVIREAARSGLVVAAHDVAEGGLAVALAEMCIPARVGVHGDMRRLENDSARDAGLASAAASGSAAFDAAAFGEAPGGFLLACAPEDFDRLAAICADIPFERIGETGGDQVVLEGATASLTLQVEEAAEAYERAVPSSFE